MNKSELVEKITLIEPFAILNPYDWEWLLAHVVIIPLKKSHPYSMPDQIVYWLAIEGILFLQKERWPRPDYCNIRLKQGMLWCTQPQQLATNSQTIYPLTDGLIGMLKESSLTILLRRSENLRQAFIHSRLFALKGIQGELYQMHMMSLTNRLVHLLLELNQWYGDDECRLPCTQKELAQILGTHRETVTMMIRPLRQKGWIRTHVRSIQLINIPMLRRLTQEEMVTLKMIGNDTTHKILLVDDEVTLLNTITAYLEKDGFTVKTAVDGLSALSLAKSFQPHLIILDIMLPGLDGLEVLQQLRQMGMNTYVLMLTAKADEMDKVIGLTVGADDYMTKPFSPRELMARVKAILRRGRGQSPLNHQLSFLQLNIKAEARKVYKEQQEIELTTTEFDLLYALARHHGRVLSREQLIEQVWGYDYYGDDRVVDVHIGRLRKKIEDDPTIPNLVVTVRGAGYRFEDSPL